MGLHLGWSPRDQNEAADSLSNGEFHEFSEGLRVPIDLAQMQWLVLPDYLAAAEALFADTKASRGRRLPAAAGPQRRRGTLRETEPW